MYIGVRFGGLHRLYRCSLGIVQTCILGVIQISRPG